MLSRIMPYRPPIEAILREVTGDPAALASFEARYSDLAVASQRWGQGVQQPSSKLAGSWSGRAATKCTWAIQDLGNQFDRIQRTLGTQAQAMTRAAAALRQARANADKVLQAFDSTREQFADKSRNVTPDVARLLAQQANAAGKALLVEAQKQKTALARILTEIAATLKAAGSGLKRERDAARKTAEARCPFTRAIRAAVINTAFNSMTPIKAAAQDLNDGNYEAAAQKFQDFGVDAYHRILKKEETKNRYAELATILPNRC